VPYLFPPFLCDVLKIKVLSSNLFLPVPFWGLSRSFSAFLRFFFVFLKIYAARLPVDHEAGFASHCQNLEGYVHLDLFYELYENILIMSQKYKNR